MRACEDHGWLHPEKCVHVCRSSCIILLAKISIPSLLRRSFLEHGCNDSLSQSSYGDGPNSQLVRVYKPYPLLYLHPSPSPCLPTQFTAPASMNSNVSSPLHSSPSLTHFIISILTPYSTLPTLPYHPIPFHSIPFQNFSHFTILKLIVYLVSLISYPYIYIYYVSRAYA